ncbi:MAG TPA: hypothetical protein VEG62_08125 [Acidimicrobiales bacterium]|nr:hypothetical protein [Acidimicrobiales bacterium]
MREESDRRAGAVDAADASERVRWGRDAAVVARAVLPRPDLWLAALGALRRMARRGWWRQRPFVPLPGEAYWRFRLETAYGGSDAAEPGEEHRLTPPDVVAFLRWCQRSRPGRG